MSKHVKLRLNMCAGDGVGIERRLVGLQSNQERWERVGYINTGATVSTVELGEEIVKAFNCHQESLEALQYIVRWHREHDSGEGELYGLDYITTAIEAIRKAIGD